jgi:glucosamine-6-phosphate deaminase
MEMKVEVYDTSQELGKAAGIQAAQLIREAIETNGTAYIILATGTSQLETLKQLVSEDINWSKVVLFHLDEYIGLPVTHPASFRKYLQERFILKVASLKAACLINGEADPQQECERLETLITAHTIDVALVGIGENGISHLTIHLPILKQKRPTLLLI